MSIEELENRTIFAGAWSSYRPLNPEDKTVFDQAIIGVIGVDYRPVEVSSQLVAGTNYRFKCIVSEPLATAIWETVLHIFKPLDGLAFIVTENYAIETLIRELASDPTLKKALITSLRIARGTAQRGLDLELYNAINEEFNGFGWPLDSDEYLSYLRSFSRLVPNEISSEKYPAGWKSSHTSNGHNQKIYDLLCHFYWLINQEIEINGRKNTLQGYKTRTFDFAQWIVNFNKLWGDFLNNPESLTPQTLEAFKNDPPYHLEDSSQYIESWNSFNDFFYRQLNGAEPNSGRSPLRPIVLPDSNRIINSPADCTYHETFPIDSTGKIPEIKLKHTHKVASIQQLLNGSEYADEFNDGTYVHHFLSPFDYHRFHTPVAGKILECKKVVGKDYLNVKLNRGQFDAPDGATNGYEFTQARGVLIIDTAESESGDIGKVAVIPIGMAQVSSVHMYTNLVGQTLDKGHEFGKFAFGGSDIIMLFKRNPDLFINKYYNQISDKQIHFKYGEASVLWEGLYNFSEAQLTLIPNRIEPPLYLLTVSGTTNSLNPEINLVNTQIIDDGYLVVEVSGKDGAAIGSASYTETIEIQKVADTKGIVVVGENKSALYNW